MTLEEIKKLLENKLNRIENLETQFHIGQKQQIADVLLMLSKLHQPDVSGRSEQLVNFLLYLNDKELINNHDFDYEKEAKKYLKKN